MRQPGTIIDSWIDASVAGLACYYVESNGRRTEYVATVPRSIYDAWGSQATRDALELKIRTQRRRQWGLGEPDSIFVWTTDLHYGQALNRSSRSDIFARICALNPAFIVDTGDTGDTSDPAQYVEFKAQIAALSCPMYYMPGDHDEGYGLDLTGETLGQVATYDTWDAAGLDRGFVVDAGPFRLISAITYKLRAPSAQIRQAGITADQVTRIETQCAAALAASKIPILCTHHPGSAIKQLDGGGYTDFADLMSVNTCSRKWGGHQHSDCYQATNLGFQDVEGGSLWINGPADARTLDSGFMLCEVYTSVPRIDISYIRARPPWDVYGPVAQNVGDATYTAIVV